MYVYLMFFISKAEIENSKVLNNYNEYMILKVEICNLPIRTRHEQELRQ